MLIIFQNIWLYQNYFVGVQLFLMITKFNLNIWRVNTILVNTLVYMVVADLWRYAML